MVAVVGRLQNMHQTHSKWEMASHGWVHVCQAFTWSRPLRSVGTPAGRTYQTGQILVSKSGGVTEFLVLVGSSCRDDFVYLARCVPLSRHSLFPYNSERTILAVGVHLREISSLTPSPTSLLVSKKFTLLSRRGGEWTLWTSRWGHEFVLSNVRNNFGVIASGCLYKSGELDLKCS